MALWTINGIDISTEWGAHLKKGAYNALLRYPVMKDYLTEDWREYDGEEATVWKPRTKARDVQMTFIVKGDSAADFWGKRDAFLAYLKTAGLFEFRLERHNRAFMFYFKGGDSHNLLSKVIEEDGCVYAEMTLSFREPDTARVFKEESLQAESGEDLQAQSDETLTANTSAL